MIVAMISLPPKRALIRPAMPPQNAPPRMPATRKSKRPSGVGRQQRRQRYGEHAARDELAVHADVEDAGAKGERNAEAHDGERDRPQQGFKQSRAGEECALGNTGGDGKRARRRLTMMAASTISTNRAQAAKASRRSETTRSCGHARVAGDPGADLVARRCRCAAPARTYGLRRTRRCGRQAEGSHRDRTRAAARSGRRRGLAFNSR